MLNDQPKPADVESPTPGGRLRKKATRKRSRKHPWVYLIKPDPKSGNGWRGRYKDPDTGKVRRESLDPLLTTAEQREDWAVAKHRAIAERRRALEHGAPRSTGTKLADAVEGYFKAHPQHRPRTLQTYRAATAKFLVWAEGNGVRSADDLTRPRLMAFRESVVRQRKHVAQPKGKRGGQKLAEQHRSAHSVNRELRNIRTVLGYLHESDLLPRLSFDDLRRGLKRVATTSERIEFLKPAECAQLLEAALRHDAVMCGETREEHRGEREKGTTPRYEAIAPFVALVLLTGMRYGEAIDLEWSQVDLDALGHDGQVAGEIHLVRIPRMMATEIAASWPDRSASWPSIGAKRRGCSAQ